MDHQEIGKILVDRWNLPLSLSEVVAFHHQPDASCNHKILTSLVHLTDFMTTKLMVGEFAWDLGYGMDESILTTLKLGNIEYLEGFINSYHKQFQAQLDSLNF